METLGKSILWLDRWMCRALDVFTITVAAVLLILLNYAVFSRFVLNASVSWGEELPAHILAMLTFIGAAYLTRTNEHLGFDGVARSLPAQLQRVLACINQLLMASFALALLWYGGKAALSFSGRMLISVDLPVILFRGAVPVGGALVLMICTVRFFGLLLGRINPNDLLPEGDG
ncbi:MULTISPECIES: TRAP transporter small permease [Nitrincola]|uniref:TRAP transporter small permease protein n=1 Tax=Nitrincola nitratireducens TaxID=1229521 RepID=W9V4T6_9GAMM|nr:MULTISPECIES: TRAP transporter small permease [Nitrincola]EXJ11152.1 TRAP-type C4-dicarboxylate transport system, small permease component [Nitrincola nitratireducens]